MEDSALLLAAFGASSVAGLGSNLGRILTFWSPFRRPPVRADAATPSHAAAYVCIFCSSCHTFGELQLAVLGSILVAFWLQLGASVYHISVTFVVDFGTFS